MPTNRAEPEDEVKAVFVPMPPKRPVFSAAPGAGDKACVFDLLRRAGNNEEPLPKPSKLHSCIVPPGERLNALPGERLRAAGFHLP